MVCAPVRRDSPQLKRGDYRPCRHTNQALSHLYHDIQCRYLARDGVSRAKVGYLWTVEQYFITEMFVTLVICVSLMAVCDTTYEDGNRIHRDQTEAGMNIAVSLARQKRAIWFFAKKGVPALQKLISETTPIKSGSKTTKSYEKRGNYYTALRDLFSVVDSKVVRERKTGNGGRIVEGYAGNKKLKLTSPGRGDTTLDIFEGAFKRPKLGDVLRPTLGDVSHTQRIVYRTSKQ